MPISPRWRAASASALSWCAWDDELVVFDDKTGNTHHLGGLGGLLLMTLVEAQAPLSISALAEGLREADGEPPLPDAVALVQEALLCLEGIGLAERDPS